MGIDRSDVSPQKSRPRDVADTPQDHTNPHGLKAGPQGLAEMRQLNVAERGGTPVNLNKMEIIDPADSTIASGSESHRQGRNPLSAHEQPKLRSKDGRQPNSASASPDTQEPHQSSNLDRDNSGATVDFLKLRKTAQEQQRQPNPELNQNDSIIFDNPFQARGNDSQANTAGANRLLFGPRDSGQLVRHSLPPSESAGLSEKYGDHERVKLTAQTEDRVIPTMRLRELKAALSDTLKKAQERGLEPPPHGVVGFIDPRNPDSPFIDPRNLARLDIPQARHNQTTNDARMSLPSVPSAANRQGQLNDPFKLDALLNGGQAADSNTIRRDLAPTEEQMRQHTLRQDIKDALTADPYQLDKRTLELAKKSDLTDKQKAVYAEQVESQEERARVFKLASQINHVQSIYDKHHWEPDSGKTGLEYLKEAQSRQKANPMGMSDREKDKVLSEIDVLKKARPDIFASKEPGKLPPDEQKLFYDIDRLQRDTRTQLVIRFGEEVGQMASALYAQQDKQGAVTETVDKLIGSVGRPGGYGEGRWFDSNTTSGQSRKSMEESQKEWEKQQPLADFPGNKSNEEFQQAYQQAKIQIAKSLGVTAENINKWADAHDERYQATLGVIKQSVFWGTIALSQLGAIPTGGAIETIALPGAMMAAAAVPQLLESGTAMHGPQYGPSEIAKDLVVEGLGAFPASSALRAFRPANSLAKGLTQLGAKEATGAAAGEVLSLGASELTKGAEKTVLQRIRQGAADAAVRAVEATPGNVAAGTIDAAVPVALTTLAETGNPQEAVRRATEEGLNSVGPSIIMGPAMEEGARLAGGAIRAVNNLRTAAPHRAHGSAPDALPSQSHNSHSEPVAPGDLTSPPAVIASNVRIDSPHSQPSEPHHRSIDIASTAVPAEASSPASLPRDSVKTATSRRHTSNDEAPVILDAGLAGNQRTVRDMTPSANERSIEQHPVANRLVNDPVLKDRTPDEKTILWQLGMDNFERVAGKTSSDGHKAHVDRYLDLHKNCDGSKWTPEQRKRASIIADPKFDRLDPATDNFLMQVDSRALETLNSQGHSGATLNFLALSQENGQHILDSKYNQSAAIVSTSKLARLDMDTQRTIAKLPPEDARRLAELPDPKGALQQGVSDVDRLLHRQTNQDADFASHLSKATALSNSRLHDLSDRDKIELYKHLDAKQMQQLANLDLDRVHGFIESCRDNVSGSGNWNRHFAAKTLPVYQHSNNPEAMKPLFRYDADQLSRLTEIGNKHPGAIEALNDALGKQSLYGIKSDVWEKNVVPGLATLTTDLAHLPKSKLALLLDPDLAHTVTPEVTDSINKLLKNNQKLLSEPNQNVNLHQGKNIATIAADPYLRTLPLQDQDRLITGVTPEKLAGLAYDGHEAVQKALAKLPGPQ